MPQTNMTITMAKDLLNPEVLADALSGQLENAVRFTPFARVDATLVGTPGDTITRPKYGYVGAAEDLEEGVPMDTSAMTMTTDTVSVKETGKAIEVTEKAILTNINGTMAEAQNQINLALADKVEIDYVEVLRTAKQTAKADFSAKGILDAIDVFNDENEEEYVLFINPRDYSKLVASLFSAGGTTQEHAVAQGRVAEVVGVSDIVKTRRVDEGEAFLQKKGAVEIVYKKRPSVNADHDILKRTFVIAANQYYGVHLYDDAGVVKLTNASTGAA